MDRSYRCAGNRISCSRQSDDPPHAGKREPQFTTDQQARLADAANLNSQVCWLLKQRKYAEGLTPAERALEIRKELLGEKHSDYAVSLSNLALLYDNLGDYAKAEPLFQQVLSIRQVVFGEKHPPYARTS